MARHLLGLALFVSLVVPSSAAAQSLGTFRWHLLPYGSVLNLNVTQQGSIYTLHGFEAQCDNPSLPVWGVAVPQVNGTVLMGLTTITEQGNGLHTRMTVFLSGFGGAWQDNANSSGTLVFNPGETCPGGPRVGPVVPDTGAAEAGAARIQSLEAALAALGAQVAALTERKQ